MEVLKWNNKGGMREMLILALPLILSNGVHSIQHFIDRMYLSWYSPEAIAAALPSSLLNFALMCLFLGTAGYVSTFVAQYFGAKQFDKMGAVLWQGIYIAVIGGVLLLAMIPFAGKLFAFIGHEPQVAEYETVYFRIVCLGAFPAVAGSAVSGFFSGLGKPWPVFIIYSLAMAINLILDYLMIFGKFGFPEMGIRGAAIATVCAQTVSFLVFIILLLLPKYRKAYGTFSQVRLNGHLFRRLVKFGLPNGIQFFLDIMGISIFIFIIGRLGTADLAATNIALNINNLIFLPMIGTGIAVSVLVGQYLGADQPDIARRVTWNGYFMTLVYLVPVGLSFVLTPQFYIRMFMHNAAVGAYAETVRTLLLFVAFYSIFDTFNIIFAAALKGAGDTSYVMYQLLIFSIVFLVLPTYFIILKLKGGIFIGWSIMTFYIFTLGLGFLLRFLAGKWQSMRVIETNVCLTVPDLADTPTLDV